MQKKCYLRRWFLWQITEKLFNWFKQGNLLTPVTEKSIGLFMVWSRLCFSFSASPPRPPPPVLSAFRCWLCSWAGLIKWWPAALIVILHSHPRAKQRPRSVFRTIMSLWLDYPDNNLSAREMLCTDWLKLLSITMARKWDYSEWLRRSRNCLWIRR